MWYNKVKGGILMEKQTLLQYLETVRDLLAMRYVHEQAIRHIGSEYAKLDDRVKNDRYTPFKATPTFQDDGKTPGKGCIAVILIPLIAGGLYAVLDEFLSPSNEFDSGAMSQPMMVVVSIVIAIVTVSLLMFIVNMKEKQDRERAHMEHQRATRHTDEENEQISAQNARAKQADQRRMTLLEESRSMVEQNLAKINAALDRLFANGVLYKDYRDLAAVCSIIQYLSSGRAQTLGESYNLYEDECFKHQIITKLDEVISRLDQIQSTQMELCRTMQSCNRSISSMNSMIDGLNGSMASIAQSEAVTAYNTDCLRRLEDYRQIERTFR